MWWVAGVELSRKMQNGWVGLFVFLAAINFAYCATSIHYGYGNANNVTQYSGFIEVDPATDTNYFFWLFEAQRSPSTAPFVVWLNGGPGSSSLLGLFEENGPYKVNETLGLVINPYSWNNVATMIYVDQPAGAGFSYAANDSDIPKNEEEVSELFYTFLQNFFQVLPQYAKLDFYIFGESYGGHYAPAIAAKIVEENMNLQPGNIKINLKGLGIGDGWVDPTIQFPSYPVYGLQAGLINEFTARILNKTAQDCLNLISTNDTKKAYAVCEGLLMPIVVIEGGLINWYNIKEKCPLDLLFAGCYNFTLAEEFLDQPAVRESLGVNSTKPFSMGDAVDLYELAWDDLQSYRDDIPKVLASGAQVLSYNGNLDLICNAIGGYQWIEQMPWPGADKFRNSTLLEWNLKNGTSAGKSKTANGLTWNLVYQAGHMVPMDQPVSALDLFTRFLFNISYTS